MFLLFRIVAILQIAGGFYGLFQATPALFAGRASLVVLIGVGLSILALVAGVLLLEGSTSGERLSRLVQALQIPVVVSPLFSYGWHLGAGIPLSLRLSPAFGFNFDWMLPSHGLHLGVGGTSSMVIGVNVLALGLWWVLWRLR